MDILTQLYPLPQLTYPVTAADTIYASAITHKYTHVNTFSA